MNKKVFRAHVTTIFVYYFFWATQQVSFIIYELDNHYELGKHSAKLTVLAVLTLCLNISSVVLGVLLFYMVEKMTHPVQDEYYDPNLKRHVPFFVYLANRKHVIEYKSKLASGDQQESYFSLSRVRRPESNQNSILVENKSNDGGQALSPPKSESRLVRSNEVDHLLQTTRMSSRESPQENRMSNTLGQESRLRDFAMIRSHDHESSLREVREISRVGKSQRSNGSVRSKGTTVALDRELFRAEDTYTKIRED